MKLTALQENTYKFVGDGYEIYEIDGNIHIVGAKTVTATNVTNLNAIGVTTINVLNNCNVNVDGEFRLRAREISLESLGDITIKTASDLITYSEGTTNIKSVDRLSADGLIIDLNNNTSKLPRNDNAILTT